MSLSFLSASSLHADYLMSCWLLCMLFLFLSFYIKDFSLKRYMRYLAPLAAASYGSFIFFFTGYRDEISLISITYNVDVISFGLDDDTNVVFFFATIVYFYSISFVIAFVLFLVSKGFKPPIRKLYQRVKGE